ncbi:hypothetical protein PBY51_014652 [Eleginops maclovinus]|uniref:Uncharacterized protein n=1 Tax=Eleginops maclovinus TaxID=56733 RepID=A0AAN7X2U5_ELEMC|nr:hypothetical protein PBY51_014652 [Eleginops maclovinus]
MKMAYYGLEVVSRPHLTCQKKRNTLSLSHAPTTSPHSWCVTCRKLRGQLQNQKMADLHGKQWKHIEPCKHLLEEMEKGLLVHAAGPLKVDR